ncbi:MULTISPECIES: ATP-dependent DNA helicase [Pseudomonas]|uniref:ATP-dependent DNA helicase n=1 Tax=Pseudomonas taiwanensis TaxID=470150 RepID=A0ABR6V3M2_9PSED|nr:MULTISPECIES: ATP-dependent DNA helicase [Pseudomonas]MBC3474487.1 ATP-dependent DNA helicase [Pseudomonas taiwanensis]MBC3489580.1 ATP-dependent DNA helicase [Pseudomonas taiwanensis]MPT00151.1 ATP-dependent DNA helicase [Pseudomonas sp.]WEZ86588.1 ATP-dependent DNA helicase [Pseudomonas sp. NyZ480]
MTYSVAVRALCEFSAKVGDLDLRFTPSPTALEGIEGHRRVVARRAADYESEITLEGQYRGLQVRGRADGYDPSCNRLEEIKTYRGDLARQPANHRQLHWAQAKVYAWLLCQARQLASIDVALVYLDVDNDGQTLISERYQAGQLQTFYETQCQRFLAWAQYQEQRLVERNQGLQVLGFPYPQFRQGQRQLAETLYKAVSTGRCLMAQASTGIGKTLGTLFPLLKAMAPQQLDKLFFLTAKTPGRALALDALRQIDDASAQPALRTLELIARDKACEHPDKACHGESCPLAQGFYDRLPAAREAAARLPMLDRQLLREVALAHQVCPYYLGQEMARWVDVVVADYNYYFDAHALLFSLTQANQWRVAVLVDEAHNLIERGRGMYSASLDQGQLLALRQSKPVGLGSALDRLNRQWNAVFKAQQAPYQASDKLPEAFLRALQGCIGVIQERLDQSNGEVDPQVLQFFFQALQFNRVAELFDEHFLFDISLRSGQRNRRLATLCLRNVTPARLLGPRMQAARSVTLFSATLSPRHFYADLLGMPSDTAWLEVAAPFRGEQLQVRIASEVSTRYHQRHASLEPIATLIAEQYQRMPGNYLAFFSSFEYLQQVADVLARRHPTIPLWLQSPGMDEQARQAFLDRFVADGQGVGFAVLGGAFGEGVDLPGTRLVGAFVATLGLPQVNPVNEQFKLRLGRQFGAGFDYAYLYPGVRKVIQAAGRVIRGDQDRGVLVLIDERFAQARVQQMFPGWWHMAGE